METLTTNPISFHEFELDAAKRLLLKNGKPVALNPKAFDLLLTLVESRGVVLSKNELLDKVWENQFVEENNLTVHVAALRKVLGEAKNEHRFIVTVPGKGYTFVAKVERVGLAEEEKRRRGEEKKERHEDGETEAINGWRLITDDGQRTNDEGQIPPLIGREREISEIKNLLRREETRLVTLTGTGGTGKTSLARAAADELTKDFSDGVFFVELAAVTNAELVVPAIANTLGVKETGDKSLIDSLKNFLRERRILLVLDNFEQLISAAPSLKELSASSLFLKILVTSRAALRLNIENELVVMPLAVPPQEANFSIDVFGKYAAMVLFVRRAQTAKPNFVLTAENAPAVADICRKLDGLPLAIELAAARIKLLAPSAIFDRLENALKLLTGGAKNLSPRQQTMRETIRWSYDLLDENEKILFRRLAVFAGGFTIEAAETVCGSDLLTLDLLDSLIDNNILTMKERADGNARLQMLEVVREFARECLEASGEAEITQQNHARFFLVLAEEAEPHLLSEQAVEWLGKLEAEHDNLCAALRRSLKNNAETAARMAAALRYFWANHSYLTEGRGWLEKALEQNGDAPAAVRLKLLNGLGQFARNQGDYAAAQKIYEEGLAAGEATNDLRQISISNYGLAALATRQGDFAAAQKFNEQGLAAARELGDESIIAHTLGSLGDLAIAKDEMAAARPLIEESLTLSKKLGDRQLAITNLVNLGVVAHSEKNGEAAGGYFSEALTTACDLGHKALISCSLDGLAAVAAGGGKPGQAAQLAGVAQQLRESIGYEIEPTERRFRDAYVAKIRAALDEKNFAAAYEQGQGLDLSEAVALAEVFASGVITDEPSAEIVIESHTFSMVVIEEESESADETNFYPQAKIIEARTLPVAPARAKNLRLSLILPLAAVLILTALGVWLYKSRSGGGGENKTNLSAVAPQLKTRIFTTAGGVPHRVSIAPDGKFAAYVQREKARDSIWLGDLETNQSIQITPASDRLHEFMMFAPDGKNIYFTARDDNHLIWTLMRVSVFGGAVEDLITGVHSQISFSPDGKRLAFLRRNAQTEQTSLIVADAETGKDERILLQPEKPQKIVSRGVSWSPDGGSIALGLTDEQGKNCDIAAVSLADGSINKIGDKACRSRSNLVWLRDGSGIVLAFSDGDDNANGQIRMVSYPSGETRKITNDTLNYSSFSLSVSDDDRIAVLQSRADPKIWLAAAENTENVRQILEGSRARSEGMHGLDVAPDGKILYAARTGDSRVVWEMNADGTNQKQLTSLNKGSDDVQISATADNRFLVFGSNRSGKSEIWRGNRDGSNLTQLTTGGGNSEPTLSPDGKWVIYTAARDGKSALWRVSIEGGNASPITNEETAWASVSPDGKYVACAFGKNIDAVDRRIAIFPFDGGSPVKIFDTAKHGILYNRLRWSPDGKAIVYKDYMQGLWRQDLDKEKPEAMAGFEDVRVFHFAYSADGKLLYSGGVQMREIIILENFR